MTSRAEVSTSYETDEFAVESVRQWWQYVQDANVHELCETIAWLWEGQGRVMSVIAPHCANGEVSLE